MRCAGQISCLEWLSPWFTDRFFSVPEAAVLTLPFPVMWLSLNFGKDEATREIQDWMGVTIKPEYVDKSFAVFANRRLTPPLQAAAAGLRRGRLCVE